ncbi:hypothetical protein [Roseomonas sp. 18066]|uniref:hypothetical protein n=1 Tax=Roseomonas sp. 18066 TaxID=2681412 RepID=UPI001359336B|nr:hypothetical protein [Roseomonas sp. 18066]
MLDGATAQLDPENEAEIQAAIAALARGRTVLIIAHRLRTVRDAGGIGVMRGASATLWRAQAGSLGWHLRAG